MADVDRSSVLDVYQGSREKADVFVSMDVVHSYA
jgi:hypothetical protein